MNIILVTNKNGKVWSLNVSEPRVYLTLFFLLSLLSGLLLITGHQVGQPSQRAVVSKAVNTSENIELAEKMSEIAQMRESVDLHMNALVLRLGKMQAQLIRLNALGQRLTDMADIDDGEFNFDALPAQGGPADTSKPILPSATDFLRDLDLLSRQLQNRERQLSVIESLLMNRNVHAQVYPAGRPVSGGWISSHYGTRRNPFSGASELHGGIDFAGKKGYSIIAVAAGVVTRSVKHAGFGRLVEIDHGNGYVTRYAHNDRNLVQSGQRVTKGQKIALMGSTGRSTGPHVHFEVLQNGKRVNPNRYIKVGR